MTTKLTCPTCTSDVTDMTLTRKFFFIDGVRYQGHTEWILNCGDVITEDLTVWSDTPDGYTIRDTEGQTLLAFKLEGSQS